MHCHVNRRLLLAALTTGCLQSAMAEPGSSQLLATRSRVLFLALRAQLNPLPQTPPAVCMISSSSGRDIRSCNKHKNNIPVDPSNDVR